ncbi:hypothetical protein P3X46_004050 [Hevea brasiliensis]|uniref:Ubiquitin-like domain-containing protein n=1 Tax=Hevea brasiliensis TaxID=3981 RepID=A0ABQ9MZD2_HEVBR|nr:polyubiquitin-like [Hevea brasiliensis]KAJ9184315.1 hypothetical protein P3X46_004050 [Hevea brasiliensis]
MESVEVMLSVTRTKDKLTIDFFMPSSATILHVKEKIEKILKYKVESQALFCNGKTLEDDHSLEFYKFGNFARLDLDELPPQKKFCILVKSPNKETLMKVKATTTVSYLKDKIEKKWGVYKDRLILAHNHEAMDNNLPLSRYNVHTHPVIEVVIQDEPR